MNQDPNIAPAATPTKSTGRNTTLIIVIVLLVLACLCVVALGLLWTFGDALLSAFGITI